MLFKSFMDGSCVSLFLCSYKAENREVADPNQETATKYFQNKIFPASKALKCEINE